MSTGTDGTDGGVETPDPHTLTGAYAVDALDDVERRAFERHLAGCPECAQEVAGLRETVARLADGVAVVPPPRLRAGVLAEVARTPQVRAPLAASPPPAAAGERRRGAGRVWMVAASVLLAIAVGTGSVAVQQYRDRQGVEAREQRIAAVLADPAARRVSATAPGGTAVTVVVARGEAVLTTRGTPVLPADRTYQLWVLRGSAVRSAGLGPAASGAGGSWVRLVDGVLPGDKVAVSVEPLGGSKQPTTTPVAVLSV